MGVSARRVGGWDAGYYLYRMVEKSLAVFLADVLRAVLSGTGHRYGSANPWSGFGHSTELSPVQVRGTGRHLPMDASGLHLLPCSSGRCHPQTSGEYRFI